MLDESHLPRQILSLLTFKDTQFKSQVRKAAVQLLTSLLESNPFAARLETEDLVKKLEEEEKKLAALCPEEVGSHLPSSRFYFHHSQYS